MRVTLEEKFKEAFAKIGQELPARPLTTPSSGRKPERDGRHQQAENKPSLVQAPAEVIEQAPAPRSGAVGKKKKVAKARPPLSSKRPNAAALNHTGFRGGLNS